MIKKATIEVNLELQDVLDYIKEIKHDIELGVIDDAVRERGIELEKIYNQVEFDFCDDCKECDSHSYTDMSDVPTYEQLMETNKALTEALHHLTGKEM